MAETLFLEMRSIFSEVSSKISGHYFDKLPEKKFSITVVNFLKKITN